MKEQILRQLVFEYWSPSKDIKWLEDYFEFQVNRAAPRLLKLTRLINAFQMRQQNAHPFSREEIAALFRDEHAIRCESGFMINKLLSGDCIYFRKCLVHAELKFCFTGPFKLRFRPDYRKIHNQQLIGDLMKVWRHAPAVINMRCHCIDNTKSDSCETCVWKDEMLKKFGGYRKKHKVLKPEIDLDVVRTDATS